MKRHYQMTVLVSFTDEQKPSSAAPTGPSLRATTEAVEVAIVAAVQSDASRSVTRKGIAANVIGAEVEETE